jgi:hypothetical protein
MEIMPQRTKKSPLIFKGSLPPFFEKLKIEIWPPHDVLNWFALLRMTPDELSRIIQKDFIGPAIDYLLRRPARGIQSGREEFTHRVKCRAAYTYCLITYWLSKPAENQPQHFKDLVAEVGPRLSRSGKAKPPGALEITVHVMEKRFFKERRSHGLKKWSENPDTFRRTFISAKNNKYMEWFKKRLRYLEETGIDLPQNLSITSEDPSGVILALTQLIHIKTLQKR